MHIPIADFESYLINKELKPLTVKEYLYYFAKFSLYPNFNQEYVNRFLIEKGNRNNVAKAFILNYQKFLKMNYKQYGFTMEQAYDISQVELPRVTGRKPRKLERTYNKEELKIIADHLPTTELKLMLYISYYSGLRLQEMINLKPVDFNWKEWREDKTQYGKARVFGKGAKERIAFIPPDLMQMIMNFLKETPNRDVNGRMWTIRERMWQNYVNKAGIDSGLTRLDDSGKIIKGTSVHPHSFRHSYGHNLALTNINAFYLKEAMGHSKIESTDRYTNLSTEEVANKLKETLKE